ncbi:MAG: DUF72 domain-containing protein, partial [candidate division WOR-3 bacterium]
VYLRMHGKAAWYSYDYSTEELIEIAQKIKDINPERVFVFFNNNHAMLKNALEMLHTLRRTVLL